MKKLISVLSLCLLSILLVTGVVFGADAVAPVVASPMSVASYFSWFTANWGLIAALWLAIEQILAATGLKSNSTFQVICNIIDAIIVKKQTPAQ
jgi:hypothetical protein